MRIAIYGSGGVGAYFGGRLAQIGQDVTFIARNESLSAMRSGGLKVGSISGDFILDRVKVTNNPADQVLDRGLATASVVRIRICLPLSFCCRKIIFSKRSPSTHVYGEVDSCLPTIKESN